MTEEKPGPPTERWDALEVMRGRAAESRAKRDQAIADLREVMSDDEARDLFGLNLGEIEK